MTNRGTIDWPCTSTGLLVHDIFIFSMRTHSMSGEATDRTFGFRVMVPLVGSRLPPMRLSSVDLPMPASRGWHEQQRASQEDITGDACGGHAQNAWTSAMVTVVAESQPLWQGQNAPLIPQRQRFPKADTTELQRGMILLYQQFWVFGLGFYRTVRANHGKSRLGVDAEVEVAEQRRAAGVAEGHVVERQDRRRHRRRRREPARCAQEYETDS